LRKVSCLYAFSTYPNRTSLRSGNAISDPFSFKNGIGAKCGCDPGLFLACLMIADVLRVVGTTVAKKLNRRVIHRAGCIQPVRIWYPLLSCSGARPGSPPWRVRAITGIGVPAEREECFFRKPSNRSVAVVSHRSLHLSRGLGPSFFTVSLFRARVHSVDPPAPGRSCRRAGTPTDDPLDRRVIWEGWIPEELP
jgi:hypothetical protein